MVVGDAARDHKQRGRQYQPEGALGDAYSKITADMPCSEPASNEPVICQSTEPIIQCPVPTIRLGGTACAMSEPTILAMGR
jgi:hypothetical protein